MRIKLDWQRQREGAPRFLHVIHYPRLSGAEAVVVDLVETANERGISSAICALSPVEESFGPLAERLRAVSAPVYAPSVELGRMGRLLHIWRTALRWQPQWIFAHSAIPAVYARLLLPSSVPRRTVAVLHATDDFRWPRLRACERIISLWSGNVIAVSEEVARNYRRQIGTGVRVSVVENGIYTAKFQFSEARRKDLRAALDIPVDGRVVLQVGRVCAQKRQTFSLRALRRAILSDPLLYLVYVGVSERGDLESERLQEMRRELGSAGGRVRVLGSRSDVGALLSAADVFVMPSTHEAHSVAAMEALASGVALVCSRIPAFEQLKGFPGVSLVAADDETEFAAAVAASLSTARRYERDVDELEVSRCFQRYADFIGEGRGSA